jgi:hypothetical protein
LVIALVIAVAAVARWGGIGPFFLFVGVVILLASIAVLWASIQYLATGPADGSPGTSSTVSDAISEDSGDDKRYALDAIHDLAEGHSLGKIDDADYAVEMARSREEAKMILRDYVRVVSPFRNAAEALARDHLRKHGFAPGGDGVDSPKDPSLSARSVSSRTERSCSSCATANDPDAVFCKRCGVRFAADP